ncbi:hypothetical protein M3Y99_01696800 [Aphelenchoides fujianensis]|nr:hypothetical protein M3Y99_01696800 [Aphelenchoides fujianensis]
MFTLVVEPKKSASENTLSESEGIPPSGSNSSIGSKGIRKEMISGPIVTNEIPIDTLSSTSSLSRHESAESLLPESILDELCGSELFKRTATLTPNLPEDVINVLVRDYRSESDDQTAFDQLFAAFHLADDDEPPAARGLNERAAIFVYKTADEKENRRLRDLHGVVCEFYTNQKNYVDFLAALKGLPFYCEVFGRKARRQVVPRPPENKRDAAHVVHQLAAAAEEMIGIHAILLKEFSEKYRTWDSRSPDFAHVLNDHANFLKICAPFLAQKTQLVERLNEALKTSKTFASLVRAFERDILNPRPSADQPDGHPPSRPLPLATQLDCVLQNLVRYKLLMQRYRKLLPAGHAERAVADEAIEKLDEVVRSVDSQVDEALKRSHLKDVAGRLPLSDLPFDVFEPSRRVLHWGKLDFIDFYQQIQFFCVLFTDYFVTASKAFGIKCLGYKVGCLRVQEMRVIRDAHREDAFCIWYRGVPIRFVSSKGEGEKWMELMNDARADLLEVQKPLEEEAEDLRVAKEVLRRCLMDGCNAAFGTAGIRRCPGCGWYLCSKCASSINSSPICSPCFQRVWELSERANCEQLGRLFDSFGAGDHSLFVRGDKPTGARLQLPTSLFGYTNHHATSEAKELRELGAIDGVSYLTHLNPSEWKSGAVRVSNNYVLKIFESTEESAEPTEIFLLFGSPFLVDVARPEDPFHYLRVLFVKPADETRRLWLTLRFVDLAAVEKFAEIFELKLGLLRLESEREPGQE